MNLKQQEPTFNGPKMKVDAFANDTDSDEVAHHEPLHLTSGSTLFPLSLNMIILNETFFEFVH